MNNLPWFLGNNNGSFDVSWGVPIVLLSMWSLIWTALALWHAARRGEKWWFVLFLVVHTAGLIEILYLLLVAKAFSSASKKSSRRGK